MMTVLYRIAYPVVWVLMKIIFPFRVIGRERFSKENRLIICANHISFLDPIFLAFACGHRRGIFFMAKSELFRCKPFGALIKALGAFPVNRGDGGEAIQTAEEIISDGRVLGIFPEGTRSKTGKLGRMKSGVTVISAATGALVQPVALVCRNQKVRPFRFTRVVVCDPVPAEEISYSEGNIKSLRETTDRLMAPVAGAIAKYTK